MEPDARPSGQPRPAARTPLLALILIAHLAVAVNVGLSLGVDRPLIRAAMQSLPLTVIATASFLAWRSLRREQARTGELGTGVMDAHRQAARRGRQAELLLALTHRNQALVDRQLEELDVLELDEPDPEVLAGLFRLDHLATRMRRNTESLLILSGEEPTGQSAVRMSLSEVVRAAVGEVEQYTRVEVVLAEDPVVSGPAAGELTHLLAELIDNATSFSGRSTLVVVRGEAKPGGYELQVKDRGRGMTDQARHQRNGQLSEGPRADLELASELGLHVVAGLAQRIGATVVLERNGNGGTTAVLTVPVRHLSEQLAPMRPLLSAALAALGSDEGEVAESPAAAPRPAPAPDMPSDPFADALELPQ